MGWVLRQDQLEALSKRQHDEMRFALQARYRNLRMMRLCRSER